jgi:DNA polymerase-3 subunit alpha
VRYKIIDGYSEEGEATIWNGQSLPLPSLVKDDRGIRSLLIDGNEIPESVWQAAKASGAQFLYRKDASWMTTEDVIDLVSPSDGLYRIEGFMWHLPVDFGGAEPQEAAEPRAEATTGSVLVHLHTHSEYSQLDGLATIDEILAQVKEQGGSAVGISDHGVVVGHPELQEKCAEAGVKPIFGMETYLVDDRFDREDLDYYHLTLWAMTDQGLSNLWSISTEGYRDGNYGKPRIDWDTLERLNEGVACGTGCLRGPISNEIKKHNTNAAMVNAKRLIDIFNDRLYVEIHANQLPEQTRVNEWLVKAAKTLDLPLLAAVDSHYARSDQRDDHQVWISNQTGKDVAKESTLFGGGQQYHMMSEDEVLRNLLYLGEDAAVEAIANTAVLAERCNASIRGREGMPTYHSGPDAIEKDIDLYFEVIAQNWAERTANKPYTQEEAFARIEKENNVLIPKNFCGYFLENWNLVTYAKDHNVLVGPGRGSGAGAFTAYIMRIVEVDPLEHGLIFERFMTDQRTALPDFDIDFPSSKKQFMIDYAISRWGEKHVCAVGTHTRIKNKGAFKDTGRAIGSRLKEGYFTDLEEISRIITRAEAGTAGLGLPFDELMDLYEEEFAPYKREYPYLFEMAEKFRGRLKSYSRHAAGLIIDPQTDLQASLPMWAGEDGILTTQFDKDRLEKLGYVKFDFLNLRNLDTVQESLDLIKAQTGKLINPNIWRDEYTDDRVFAEIRDGWTLGLFQIETSLGTKTVKQLKPRTLADLSDCITLGRPGPIRSGLDKIYFRRREGKEKVTFADKRLEGVLKKTYGTMIYQEDIMAVTITLANYSSGEADEVRKILGKKKKEKAEEAGIKFVQRAVEYNTDKAVAESLWAQMAEFALYSFNRAHAFSYAMLAYWTAWLKVHYPVQFLVSCLSTIDKDELPDYVSEARRLGCTVLPPDINQSGSGFRNTDRVIRYGLDSIKGIAGAATEAITQAQPYTSWDDFLERKGEKCNAGHIKTLAHVGAFDSLVPNRKALEIRLADDEVKPREKCIFFQTLPLNKYNDLPCGYDWDSEPLKVGRTGKPVKRKGQVLREKNPPKVCSKACSNWTPRPPVADDEIEPYTDAEIRQIEMEALGIYLSSSPFDIIPEDDKAFLISANQLRTEPNGCYLTAILVTRAKDHTTRDGKPMKFLTVDTTSGTMDITVFSDKVSAYANYLSPGQLALAEVRKDNRGTTLRVLKPIN